MENKSSMIKISGDLFSGAGLGLLLGTIVGLSGSPVVAVVVGSLTSLLAVFLGLDGKDGVAAKLPSVNAARIGAFGFVTVIGLGLGLHARVNNTFAQPPAAKLAEWEAVFPDDPDLVKQLVIFDQTGLSPGTLTFGTGEGEKVIEVALDTSAATKQSILFDAGFSDFDACTQLRPDRFATSEKLLTSYQSFSAPDLVKSIGGKIESLPIDAQEKVLSEAHSFFCTIQFSED